MIKPKQDLSIVRQCKLLDIHRSDLYHRPRPSSPINLALMREIDEIHLNRPFLGVRRVTDELCEKGHEINHKRIHRLMQIMGIEAIYPKPNTSKRNPAHKIYPYLLRNLDINRGVGDRYHVRCAQPREASGRRCPSLSMSGMHLIMKGGN